MGNLNSILNNSLCLLDDIIAKSSQRESQYLSLLEQRIYHALHKTDYPSPAVQKTRETENNNMKKTAKPMQRIDREMQKQINEEFVKNLKSIRGRIKDKKIPKK